MRSDADIIKSLHRRQKMVLEWEESLFSDDLRLVQTREWGQVFLFSTAKNLSHVPHLIWLYMILVPFPVDVSSIHPFLKSREKIWFVFVCFGVVLFYFILFEAGQNVKPRLHCEMYKNSTINNGFSQTTACATEGQIFHSEVFQTLNPVCILSSQNYFQLPRASEHEEHISWCL